MVFNSLTFLLFFVVFINLYWLISRKLSLQFRNIFILLSSYLFYGWWDWRFLGLIIISTGADYLIGMRIGKVKSVSTRKSLLALSIFINLGILGFFKYFNFFIDSLNELLLLFSAPISTGTLNIILPVGISFYTFQSMSYTIDIFRNKIQPTRDPFAFFAFVAFFPQLVAGPIERAGHLLPQFLKQHSFSYSRSVSGLQLVLWGLFKKIVIADNFGVLVEQLFDPAQPASAIATLAGGLFFTLQIYADFSGYSDIAIGIARMLGFDLMQNFRTPFFSASLQEFWQRWHISLSTWFRDYVYIPLGGSHSGQIRFGINILITFLLSGLWHGAAVTFLIWGALHGVFYLVERPIRGERFRFLRILITFILVCLFFIPFRTETTTQLLQMTSALFETNRWGPELLIKSITSFSSTRFITLMVVTLFFGMIEWRLQLNEFSSWIAKHKKPVRLFTYYALLLLILLLGNFDVKPNFIYFQF
ncbi:MAG: MBOAT family protein [Bacteroidales bacterium]|nr:MBOAT family protein [Bacteroidales bacterium]